MKKALKDWEALKKESYLQFLKSGAVYFGKSKFEISMYYSDPFDWSKPCFMVVVHNSREGVVAVLIEDIAREIEITDSVVSKAWERLYDEAITRAARYVVDYERSAAVFA